MIGKQLLVSQFGRPHGLLGRVAGKVMAARPSSVARSVATVELLDLRPDARVLELGHGPGVGLERVVAAVPRGKVVGLEYSATMSRMAARRNRTAVRDGRLALVVGDAQHPPEDLGYFDAIFSCNVWLFWSDPVDTLRRLRGHMTPGGTMAVTFRPPGAQATSSDAFDAGGRIAEQLRDAGYVDVRIEPIEHHELGDVPAICVIGRSSSPHRSDPGMTAASQYPDGR